MILAEGLRLNVALQVLEFMLLAEGLGLMLQAEGLRFMLLVIGSGFAKPWGYLGYLREICAKNKTLLEGASPKSILPLKLSVPAATCVTRFRRESISTQLDI